jgi:hypothetical protein
VKFAKTERLEDEQIQSALQKTCLCLANKELLSKIYMTMRPFV